MCACVNHLINFQMMFIDSPELFIVRICVVEVEKLLNNSISIKKPS